MLFPRINRRLALFAVTAVVAVWLMVKAGGVLLPFALGLSFAYFVAPLVVRIDRMLRPRLMRWGIERFARPIAIVILYLLVAGVFALIGLLIVPPLVREMRDLVEAAPQLYAQAESRAQDLVRDYNTVLPEQARVLIEDTVTEERLEELGLQGLDILRARSARHLGGCF